jgi:hypothetical protein
MATAICAWLHRRGVRVAPFKAQNMSNNSYSCLQYFRMFECPMQVGSDEPVDTNSFSGAIL